MKALIDGFSNALRSGAYMDRDRALVGAGIFGAFSFLGVLFMLATSDGLKDFMGRPLGNDFIVIYAGGRTAIADGAAAIYDVNRIFAQHQAILQEEAPHSGPFLYPPVFIPVAMAIASAPNLAAWLGWMALTGAGYLAATRAIAFLLQDMRRTGFRDYEKTLLVILFVAPALTRMVTAATSVSFALVILAALLLIAWRRAQAPHQTAPA